MELQQQSVKRFKTMLMSWVNLKQYHVPFILARLFYLIGNSKWNPEKCELLYPKKQSRNITTICLKPFSSIYSSISSSHSFNTSSLILQMEKLGPTFLMPLVISTKIFSERVLKHFLGPLQTAVKKMWHCTKNEVFH